MALTNVRTCIIDARRRGGHTDYAIRVQGYNDQDTLVYRRYSAFVSLRKYVTRHLSEGQCCGGRCLLENFLKELFVSTEFYTANFLIRNSTKVVQDRVYFLNDFLQRLQEALAKCPPRIIQRCEKEGCKVSKLLKSFLGAVSVLPVRDSECE